MTGFLTENLLFQATKVPNDVILTADTDWVSTILDHEMEDGKEWFDAMQDMPDIEPDPLFDDKTISMCTMLPKP